MVLKVPYIIGFGWGLVHVGPPLVKLPEKFVLAACTEEWYPKVYAAPRNRTRHKKIVKSLCTETAIFLYPII